MRAMTLIDLSVAAAISLLVVGGCGGSGGSNDAGSTDGGGSDGGDAGGGCTDPLEPGRFYVNPDAPPGQSGAGTRNCPFQSLATALAFPANGGLTICTEGTFDPTIDGDWPKAIPANVTLDGTYCGHNNTHTVFLVPTGLGGVSFMAAPAGIRGYDIVGLGGSGLSTSTLTVGMAVESLGLNAAIEIEDVRVAGFEWGIFVDGSSVKISDSTGGVVSTGNSDGLVINAGSSVSIEGDQNSGSATMFSANGENGIRISGASVQIKGQPYTGALALSRTVAADGNNVGIAIDSDAHVVIDNFEATNNVFRGITVDDTVSFSMTGSVLTGNQNGLYIQPGTAGTPPDVSNIDLGTAATGASAGNNHIFGNSQAGVCITATPTGTMAAMGNIWSADASKDCTGTPTTPLTHTPDCTAAVDVAHGSANMTVDACTFQ
jgi:hypothetical protein